MGCMLAASLLAGPLGVHAEDIDLFVQPAGNTGLPNVLLMVDNTGNWSAPYTNEIQALVDIFTNLSTNTDGSAKYRVGVMFATETGSGDSNVNGGYVRAAVRPMTTANRALYATMFSTLDVGKDKGNSGASGLAMAEAYRYFAGGAPYAGNNKNKTDYTGNAANGGAGWANANSTAASRSAAKAIFDLTGNALGSKAGTTYVSPVPTGTCGNNFIIYISNGPNQEAASADTISNNMLAAAGGSTTQLPISPSGSATNPSDEWARFMKSALGVTVYSVDVNPGSTGQGPGWTALLKSMAEVTSGNYYAVTSSGTNIKITLDDIFSRIQSVNSVFASVSLPVSVNTEGTYLNQVYVGMFRPDADGGPRWDGNLKQYKLAKIGTTLRTVDAYDYPDTINPLTGFVDRCARSYWTPTTMDSYWQFKPQGDCTTIPAIGSTPAEPLTNAAASNRPDGNIVEKGAQAYVLRSSTTRTIKTCSSTFTSCTSLIDFNTTNVSPTDLGLASTNTAERDLLVNWAKGIDNKDDEGAPGVTTNMRQSAHGDVVHSRPVAINFGPDTSPRVVVIYGGNDGILRAVNGNRSTSVGSVGPGQEYWAFMPPEFYPQIKRLRDNTTSVSYKNTDMSLVPTPQPKPYGMDGPITLDKQTAHTWFFTGMRRGGRVLYAFDATGLGATTPTDPTLMWKKGCPNLADDTGCTTGLDGLGQTWSAPKVFKAAGYGSGASPMLIMGGGHDNCEDSEPNTCSSSSKGRHIYILDAAGGTLLKTFDTTRPVVGDVFVIPDDTTGMALWAYAADMGGNIYRISGVDANTAIGHHRSGQLDDHEDRIPRVRHAQQLVHDQPQVHVLSGRRQGRRQVRAPDRLGRSGKTAA
jgi:type IV pilus assembly protein PilY1